MYAWLFKRIFLPVYESGLRGRKTLAHLRRLEEQQWLAADELRELQWRKLMDLLAHAAERVPFYRERMRKAGLTVRAVNSPDDLRKLPPLTKQDIRDNQQALVAEGVAPASLYASGTGGSTGEPLHFRYDHAAYEWRVAAAARADRWAGWDWGERQFYIWGVELRKVSRVTAWKKRIHNAILRLQSVSAFDLRPDTMPEYARRLNRFRPAVVVGYAAALCEFARFCEDNHIEMWQPRGVIPTAERIFDEQFALIGRVFRCGVFNRYGCREVMNIAAECDRHEGMHLNADNLYFELETDGRAARPGEPGDVLLTDLNNYSMPFIRYRNGDVAVAAAGACSCGRGLPLLTTVEGRVLDLVVTPAGKYVSGVFWPHLLKNYDGIKGYQIHQHADHSLTVRLVTGEGFAASSGDDIRARISEKIGAGVPVEIEQVDEIPLTQGGKRRITISEVGRAPRTEP